MVIKRLFLLSHVRKRILASANIALFEDIAKQNSKKTRFFIVISLFFCYFASKFKLLNMDKKKLNRLKLVLVEKDKTGVWLAEQLGVTAVTVSKWCSNITQPTLPTLDKIAELLECEKRELIND